MNIVQNLTDDPNQSSSLLLLDGSSAVLTLYYRPQQTGWFYDLQWSNPKNPTAPFNLYGQRLVTSPNLLRQYQNIIQFGLMVQTVNQAEPLAQSNLIDGTTTIYLLSAADIAAQEALIYPGL